jgi:LysM repeat protein
LHARAATRDEEDYEEESEPNMKFSHALIVVLVLHVLAVGGVFAFNMLKTNRVMPGKQKAPVAEKQEARPQAAAVATSAAPAEKTSVKTESKPPSASAHTVAAGDTLTKIASQHKTAAPVAAEKVPAAPPKAVAVKSAAPAATPVALAKAAAPVAAPVAAAKAAASPEPKPAANPAAKAQAAAGTHTVAKGENPFSIAKKWKVSYSALLKANKIEDPTKLQIGQKLIIP